MQPSPLFTFFFHYRSIGIIALTFLFVLDLIAQDSPNPYKRYGTQAVWQRLVTENPELPATVASIEAHVDQFETAGTLTDYQLPIVFHVLTPNQPGLLADLIAGQVLAANQDFAGFLPEIRSRVDSFAHFDELAVATEIAFCTPLLDPNGNPTDGVNIDPAPQIEWRTDDAIKSSDQGGVDPWDPERYINIWIAQLEGNLAGYAQLPGGPAATDGIVIDVDFFGSGTDAPGPPQFALGKTLTHLLGSYLGLHELWNEYEPCTDDRVADTPIHNAPNPGRIEIYRHLSTCPGTPVEMTMNFMDTADDSLSYVFTPGQKLRMQAMLAAGGPRAGLTETPLACPPLPDDAEAEPESVAKQTTLRVFPNPARDRLTVRLEGDAARELRLIVYSTDGQLFYRFDPSGATQKTLPRTLEIDCHGWPPGFYFVQVVADDQRFIRKLAITH